MLIRRERPDERPPFIQPRRTLSGIAYAAPATGLAERYCAELRRAERDRRRALELTDADARA